MTVFTGGVPSPLGTATADGASPFSRTAVVVASAVSAANTTAVDSVGVFAHEGLSTGSYNATSFFTIEARDRFGNRVLEGPLKERQIVLTACAAPFARSGCGDGSHSRSGLGRSEATSPAE